MIVSFTNKKLNVVVGGVLKDAPFNSSFTENILMRIENYLDVYNYKIMTGHPPTRLLSCLS